jgi:predicted TIM-barrel fold metal-dependent hydrolase
MEATARIESPNRSFVVKVMVDPEKPSRYLAWVRDEQGQSEALLGIPDVETKEDAKQQAELALRSYLKTTGVVLPNFPELNWTDSG